MKIVLSGGGTGGHIYPAIAIADALKERYPEAQFLFIGAKGRMEMEKIPEAGYPIKGLWISGLERKIALKNFLFPLKLLYSLFCANRILKQFNPNVVIGTGGFASGPVLYMAAQRKIPTVLQEQNAHPGITNRLLGKKASLICVAYDGLERFFPKEKIIKTGNPVRQALLAIKQSTKHKKTTLLVLGGSLGSKKINELIASKLDWLHEQKLNIIWQTGILYYEQYRSSNAETHAFLKDMVPAYTAADIIISRAGAIAISELCIVGKPTLFIPSPNVAEDHQTKNAQAIVAKDAALILEEHHLDAFEETMLQLLDKKKQEILATNMKALAKPAAAQEITNEITKLLTPYN